MLSLLCVAVGVGAQMPDLSGVVERFAPGVQEEVPQVRPIPTDRAFKLQSARSAEQDGKIVRLKGEVRFTFREFTVRCDEAEGDLETEIFRLKGNVFVTSSTLNYEGREIVMNFKEKTAEFASARSVLKPELIGGELKDNLFVQGERGTGGEKRYSLDRGVCTTCGLPHPHYHISARRIDVIANDKVVLRDAALSILGRRVLSLPYMSLPLDERLPRYIPETGQSQDEGYFIKSRWGVGIAGDELLDARLDYMTKLGFGVGGDFTYRDLSKSINGSLKLYGLIGPQDSLTGALSHTQRFGAANLNVSADYSRRNYLTSPNNTQLSLRNTFTTPFLGGQSRLAFNRTENRTTNFRTQNQILQLSDSRTWRGGPSTQIDLSFSDYSARSGAFAQDRRVLDVNARAAQRFGNLDAELAYQRTVPISEIVNFFSATDRTPIISLRSDSNRLFQTKNRWNPSFDLSVGELVDATRRRPITRINFETVLPNQTLQSGALQVQGAGRFKQSLYSDDTAQFIVGLDSSARWRFGKRSGLNLRYNYLRPQGFTPLSIDQTGRSDLFGADVALELRKDLLVAAQTGFDLLAKDRNLASSWQLVGARLEYSPSSDFQIRTSANYDTFSQVWNVLRMDASIQQGSSKYYVGLRYDGQRNTWGAVNFIGEGMRWGRLTTSVLLAYNGYTKRFESRQLSFMYDMHCTEALLEIIDNQTGFRNGTSVAFFIRLKALPFTTPFGRGTRGQGSGFSGGFGTGFGGGTWSQP